MISFKEFITERQQASNVVELAFGGNIALTDDNIKSIFPMFGKRDTFRHATDLEGLGWLLKNEGQKGKGIAVEKFGKNLSGLLTQGGIAVIMEGDYHFWFPQDVGSSLDRKGVRWFHLTDIIDNVGFVKDYLAGYEKIVNKHPEFKVLKPMQITPYKLLLHNTTHVTAIPIKEQNAFMADIYDLQRKTLNKHSKEIGDNILSKFNTSKQNPFKTSGNWDEAIIDNHKVLQVLIKPFSNDWGQSGALEAVFHRWNSKRKEYSPEEATKFLKDTNLYESIELLKKHRFKGLISIRDDEFRTIKQLKKEHGFDEFMDELGLKFYKSVFWKLK
jgi:hypothetical protein